MNKHLEKALSELKTYSRRRRFEDLTLEEVSAVDRPAQEPARAAIMKRDEPQSFEAAMDEIKRRDGLSGTEAMRATRVRYPELVTKMNAEATVTEKRESATEKTVRDFLQLVEQTSAERRISKMAAARAVRRENPKLFDAMQA